MNNKLYIFLLLVVLSMFNIASPSLTFSFDIDKHPRRFHCLLKNQNSYPIYVERMFETGNTFEVSSFSTTSQCRVLGCFRRFGHLGPPLSYFTKIVPKSEVEWNPLWGDEYISSNEWHTVKWLVCDRFQVNSQARFSCVSSPIHLRCKTASNAPKSSKTFLLAQNVTNHMVALGVVVSPCTNLSDDIAFLYFNSGLRQEKVDLLSFMPNSLIISNDNVMVTNSIVSLLNNYIGNGVNYVAPGECAEWRYPWKDITNALPQNVYNALKNADYVKLRWQCGEMISEPLSLWIKKE